MIEYGRMKLLIRQTKEGPWFDRDSAVSRLRDDLFENAEELIEKAEKADEYEDCIDKISDWCRAYPLDMFPEPDIEKARRLLDAGGMLFADIYGSAGRSVLGGIERIIKEATAKEDKKE